MSTLDTSSPYADPAAATASRPPRAAAALRGGAGLSFRAKTIAALVVFGIAVWTALAVGLILNARNAVEEEVLSSFSVASRYLASRRAEIQQAAFPDSYLATIGLDGGTTRHVRATVIGPSGAVIPPRDGAPLAADDEEPPAWFFALLAIDPLREDLAVPLRGGGTATIVLESDPHDEIEEVWEDFRFVMPITIGSTVMLLGAAILLMNHVFSRLTVITRGLETLIDGRLDVRVNDLKIFELAVIVDRFNDLAERLSARDAENQALTRRLLTIQDEERRRIAHDLHDELGPYLFGVRATTEGLARTIAAFETQHLNALKDGLGSLTDLTQSIQARTRKLISSLRPMSLGEVPLADLVEDFVETVGRFAEAAEIRLTATTGSISYGEATDLTVYRFVQEGIINALRHGGAGAITVTLEEVDGTSLSARVTDDGAGPGETGGKTGYGLAGMAERVKALGGAWRPPLHRDGTTTTEILLPIDSRHRLATEEALPLP